MKKNNLKRAQAIAIKDCKKLTSKQIDALIDFKMQSFDDFERINSEVSHIRECIIKEWLVGHFNKFETIAAEFESSKIAVSQFWRENSYPHAGVFAKIFKGDKVNAEQNKYKRGLEATEKRHETSKDILLAHRNEFISGIFRELMHSKEWDRLLPLLRVDYIFECPEDVRLVPWEIESIRLNIMGRSRLPYWDKWIATISDTGTPSLEITGDDKLRYDQRRSYFAQLKREFLTTKKKEILKSKTGILRAKAAKNTDEQRDIASEYRCQKRYKQQMTKINCCPYCECLTPLKLDTSVHLDHIYPVSKGGLSVAKNLIFICEPCNQAKSDDTIINFARKTGYDLSRLLNRLEFLGKDA
jgi:5-methylcytosine-specific restriction endonuclease McrA